ncbi:transmembrane protein, putative [Medicago truncatula]|uniref:Transmembrane protein, putative n=1 Tax=Medicago truncatula TaxID=3880 RepID=A0A072UKA6_MEDTR|nr:transmembrane protein, putative [Medicago truncatula]
MIIGSSFAWFGCSPILDALFGWACFLASVARFGLVLRLVGGYMAPGLFFWFFACCSSGGSYLSLVLLLLFLWFSLGVGYRVNDNASAMAEFSIYVDAGCFSNEQTGWGLIVKNHDEAIVFKACTLEELAVEPALAEALGLYDYYNTHLTMIDLVEKVKYHSLWWMKANHANFVYGTSRWWSDPLICLGID